MGGDRRHGSGREAVRTDRCAVLCRLSPLPIWREIRMFDPLLNRTRRHFFRDCGVGLGAIALTSVLERDGQANPLALKPPHFPAKAKRVIYLFMAGGPSQLELFDEKPKLTALNGQPIPDEFLKGKRFAFMDTFAKEKPKLLAARRKFTKHGQSGA